MPDTAFLSVFGPRQHAPSAVQLLSQALGRAPFEEDLKQLRLLWLKCDSEAAGIALLRSTVKHLTNVQESVLQTLDSTPLDRVQRGEALRLLHAHFVALLPEDHLVNTLKCIFFDIGSRALQLRAGRSTTADDVLALDSPETAIGRFKDIVKALHSVGLAESRATKAWALSVDELLDVYVEQRFGVNDSDTEQIPLLHDQMTTEFSAFVHHMSLVDFGHGEKKDVLVQEGLEGQWARTLDAMAVKKLGQIRSRKLCADVLADAFRPLSPGVIADLAAYISTPHARNDITTLLQKELARNLLHSGCSTVQILEAYVRIIGVFKDVDPSGVVLRRVSEPIKSFLRTRTDVVRIIINSLLESSKDDKGMRKHSTETFCASIAECMEMDSNKYFKEYYEGSDLNDPDWKPEPVDAAVGHQATRNLDAMAHLITLESRETFTRELQSVLATRLLATATATSPSTPGGAEPAPQGSFAAEIRLLNTMKQRFSDYGIANCEIMLRDMLDSERLNADLRTPGTPAFHAVVLSRVYWPTMPEWSAPCAWAPPADAAAQSWERAFAQRKARRRLDWLRCAGRATLELALADRVVVASCTPWQAAVVQAFHDDDDARDAPASRSVDELVRALGLDEAHVRAACAFWLAQRVLAPHASAPDAFTVQERLPLASAAAATPPPPPPARPAPADLLAPKPKTAADLLAENGALYAQFVAGMLTNQGAMNAARIRAMLRMAVPGGFPFAEDELVAFLEGLADAGRVERAAGLWRIRR